jgi:hypothetical protein
MKTRNLQSNTLLSRALRNHINIPQPLIQANTDILYEILRKELPITTYNDYQEKIEHDLNNGVSLLSRKKTIFFATTSGMSGIPKIIPHNRPSINNYLYAVTPIYLRILSKYWKYLLKGKIVPVVGKKEDSKSPQNISLGSMTGYMTKLFYHLCPVLYSYSPIFAEKLKGEERFNYILDSIVKKPIAGILGSNPYLIKKLLEDAKEMICLGKNENMLEVFPRLKFISCITGQPATYHSKQLAEFLDNKVDICDYGVSASEAAYTSGLLTTEPIGTLVPCLNSLIEWIPIDENPNQANTFIEDFIGCRVQPLLTSSNGFIRYKISDEYLVEKRNDKPILRFLKRSEDIYSVTFEKVTSENVELVMQEFQKQTNIKIKDYICIVQNNPDDKGKYLFIISLKDARYVQVQKFINSYSELIDKIFCEKNPEYRNARINNIGLFQTEILCGSIADKALKEIRKLDIKNLQSKPINIAFEKDLKLKNNLLTIQT